MNHKKNKKTGQDDHELELDYSYNHIRARAQKKKLNELELELEPIKLDELASSSTHLHP